MAMKNTTFLVFCLVAISYFNTPTVFSGDAKAVYTLQSQRKSGQTDRITVLMEVGGEFKEQADSRGRGTAMKGTANLDYHEMTLDADPNRLRSVRYYETAKSAVRFKDGSHTPSLSESRRLVGVAVDPPSSSLFSLREPLSRDELEVIDILGNSLLLDRLLPEEPVAIGATWKPTGKTAAALLGLDSAKHCELQCTLKEVAKTVARFEFSGSVEGPVNDTTAKITLKGKYRFDLKTRRIDWFAMVTEEKRETSQVAVGFDVVVRLQMTILPDQPSPELSEAKLASLTVEPTPESSLLRFESVRDRWQITYDHHWYLNSDDPENAVLKLIQEGALAGHCKIVSLPQRDTGKLVSLDEFQEEVRQVMGKEFGEFVEAKQSVNLADLRVLRVVVHGVASGKSAEVPIQWICYHLADQEGRQVAVTFVVEQERLERFAEADRSIVESLRFMASAERGPLAKPEVKAQTKGFQPLVK
jgi:hypothetical protein